ncbi:glucosyltransferase [Escherichia coli KTE89]|nr:glucosyltransferase [Escherichia coli KTE72]ELE84042.1 glucosyltransferase [Escherichia coli KTE86]ELH35067.1 glucosyltransferase [Escherichia coli KTE183]EOV99944.1 glucosyltransferase [Escherichia coli KTE89]
MKTWIFICMAVAILLWFLSTLRRKPSQKKGCIDAIIPAYNEGPCLAQSLDNLLRNPYFCRVICVNDGSTDNTEAVMAEVKRKWGDRFVAVTQKNTGKGGALMNGLNYATCDQVFLSDADTYVPPDQDGMGYMLAEIERGADAVGGIPSTALKGAGLLPHIRATVKLPMIVMKRTLQQLLGGAPFIISGACGMFRTDVLRKFGFSDRTKVEDLDLTWTLVANGYRIRQANRCIVYPQECNSPREEWRRWRRWGVGLWATRSVCACIKDFYLAASVSSVYFLCCWLCFMALVFISLPGLMNSSPPGHMVWCWQCSRLSGSA